MGYMEQLKRAKTYNINVTELWIVDNVVTDVANSVIVDLKTQEEFDNLVETICDMVKWFYIKTNGLSISDISRAVCELHFDDMIPLNDINRDMVYERVDSYYL